MREIKFRAWNSSISVLANVIEIRFNQNSILTDDSKFLWDLNKAVLEQYTGLKDFNGAEIYEGDIVDTHWGNEENRLVKYDNEMGFYLTPDQDQSYWTVAYRGEYEVIGNIHENADLLNDTDRISPDDIGNDIHDFLHGEYK